MGLTLELFADDHKFGRGLDADPHTAWPYPDNRHADLIANENPLADFSR